jgi:para-aminobenzoate synthetase component I
MRKTFVSKDGPFSVFKKFYGNKGLFFLDSSQRSSQSQFSYLGHSPFKVIEGRDINVLRREFNKHRVRASSGFFGGAVGYFNYDGSFCFGFYDHIIVFDHVSKTITACSPHQSKINELCRVAKEDRQSISQIKPLATPIAFKSNFNKSSYVAMVKKALAHIKQGDIYQINLSRKVEAIIANWPSHADSLSIYQALREHSPSPFAAYYEGPRQTILSSSPERFIKLAGRRVQVKPMKGTRPRGETKLSDERLKAELFHSPKEIAELLMVTDLERNDLGRVCGYGSVKVKTLRTIETYQTVFQATATIEGRLHKDRDCFDLIKAAFPSGSVTGCPKIEAMKIIENLENTSRGAYTGALGYISFAGDMDLSVIIRSLFLQKNKIAFHVGGGIVADSNPAAEYEETNVKARAMEQALAEVFHA